MNFSQEGTSNLSLSSKIFVIKLMFAFLKIIIIWKIEWDADELNLKFGSVSLRVY